MAGQTISVRNLEIPVPANPFPSPGNDWQDEVIYFLVPDRFSDGRESARAALNRGDLQGARGPNSNWQNWSYSGAYRYQGGTLSGIKTKLSYLKNLGITALWIAPVFRQRRERNTFHGYAIQDFLEVEPRLGTKNDLVNLVQACHAQEIRVILDVVFNHSGDNWIYSGGEDEPAYQNYPNQLPFGQWRDGSGQPIPVKPVNPDDGVWPVEFQDANVYMRAGLGDLAGTGNENPDDGTVPFRRSDFPQGFRKFNHYAYSGLTLSDLARCYKYWIGLTDCDGFRIDTVKHVTVDVARAFTGAIKEFAAGIGKNDFFLVAEIAGGDKVEDEYLSRIDAHKLNAALDIGEGKKTLRAVARGLEQPSDYLGRYSLQPEAGESRKAGSYLVSLIDDHDNIVCERIRFPFSSPHEHQIAAGIAIQIFTLSIPCIYYGSEQALSYNGATSNPGYQVNYLTGEGWGSADQFLREAMFGPEHPLVAGSQGNDVDTSAPGFGPFGTSGFHCFDDKNPVYVRIAHLLAVRKQAPALRTGRQYQRPLGQFGWSNLNYPSGELIAWSRILDDREFLIVVNGNGVTARGADVLVDYNLNPSGSSMGIVANTAQAAALAATGIYTGNCPVGSSVTVNRQPGGPAYVTIASLDPSEVVILASPGA